MENHHQLGRGRVDFQCLVEADCSLAIVLGSYIMRICTCISVKILSTDPITFLSSPLYLVTNTHPVIGSSSITFDEELLSGRELSHTELLPLLHGCGEIFLRDRGQEILNVLRTLLRQPLGLCLGKLLGTLPVPLYFMQGYVNWVVSTPSSLCVVASSRVIGNNCNSSKVNRMLACKADFSSHFNGK